LQKRAAEKKEAETKKEAIVQVDDLLTFRQFSKKMADEVIDVSQLLHSYEISCLHIEQDDEDVGRATGAGEVQEDFISNLSRIAQLTGKACYADRQ